MWQNNANVSLPRRVTAGCVPLRLSLALVCLLLIALGAGAVEQPLDDHIKQVDGNFFWHYAPDKVKIGGQEYAAYGAIVDGNGDATDGTVTLNVSGYDRFTATAGVRDGAIIKDGEVSLLRDNQMVFYRKCQRGNTGITIDIPLKGAHTLTIRVIVMAILAAPTLVKNDAPPPPPPVTTPEVHPNLTSTNPRDNAEMVLVPAGEFLMGSADTDPSASSEEKPQRRVYLDAYFIYKTPVTVAQYRAFCQATGRAMPVPPAWGWIDTHPMVNVSWEDATAYARWAQVALPTEAQWEKAARGTDGRIYPWGNAWDAGRAQYSKLRFGDAKQTAPVGSFPASASPYGALDMAGNVWQWCADWFHASNRDMPDRNPTGPTGGGQRVLHGGGWYNNFPQQHRAAARLKAVPVVLNNGFGFRCAVPAAVDNQPVWVTTVANLTVKSTPPGGLVWLNGQRTDKTTPCTIAVELEGLPNEPLTVTVELTGYKRAERTITVTPGQEQTVDVTLAPADPLVKPPTGPVNPVDGAELVLIKPGPFLMGTPETDTAASDDEKPQHRVTLDAYFIYKNLVTVAQYRQFCKATKRQMPQAPEWGWLADHPIVNVTWEDANAYAQWAGASLPTEAQWEKAARGTEGLLFPWGNTWDESCCNNGINGPFKTSTVGSYPNGASPYTVLDMAGNVWQWCADWYDAGYYRTSPAVEPTGPTDGKLRVVRGSSWFCRDLANFHTTYRGRNDAARRDIGIGFRCVLRARKVAPDATK